MITRRAALAGLAVLPIADASAQQPIFPSKALTLIVPFPPGGPADIFGRFLAEGMAEDLGKPVVVENKSGVAGVAGMDVVAKAATDAHVMGLMSASAGAIMPTLMSNMPYDAARARVLLGRAYRACGNSEHAELELHAAATSFERLGAGGDARSTAALVEA